MIRMGHAGLYITPQVSNRRELMILEVPTLRRSTASIVGRGGCVALEFPLRHRSVGIALPTQLECRRIRRQGLLTTCR
jgi:hypothetical protein